MAEPRKIRRGGWKRWVARLIVLAAVGFLLLNIVAYRQAYAMTHFSAGNPKTGVPESLSFGQKVKVLLWGVNLPRPPSTNSAAELGTNARSLTIPGQGNIKLGAWYSPAAAGSSLVILFHGYGGEKSALAPEARVFQELGCSVLLVDFRGSGESSESYTTIGYFEAEDVAAAARYAREKLAPGKILLYGQSMGAAAVLRAIHDCGVKPDGIIVEAVFDRLLSTVRHRFEAMNLPSFPGAELLIFWGGVENGFNGFGLNPVDYAQSVRCPILFLHGAADPRAHLDEGRRVCEAVPGPKDFREFPQLGHASVIASFPAEWRTTVANFFKTNSLATEAKVGSQ